MRIVFAMPGNDAMAADIAALTGAERGDLETRRFPDGESHVRIRSDVRGKRAALVCTLARPDEQIMPLVLAAGALRDWGARSVVLVAPYLAYMRQDAHFESGDALSAAHFARLLSAHFDALVTIDPHLHRIRDLREIYTIPARAAHAAPLLGEWIATNVRNPLLIGPDSESSQWVAAAASVANAEYVVLSKVRRGDRAVDLVWPDLAPHIGITPVLLDDIAASGETLVRAAEGIVARGFVKPICVIVHALLDAAAETRLAPMCRRVVSTNTVLHDSNAISVAAPVAGLIWPHD